MRRRGRRLRVGVAEGPASPPHDVRSSRVALVVGLRRHSVEQPWSSVASSGAVGEADRREGGERGDGVAREERREGAARGSGARTKGHRRRRRRR
uniref:Uncharacterized protein n=1 Tax=Arundo donax TaxID=35708 RepID=A0A0A9DXB8_ARUDO